MRCAWSTAPLHRQHHAYDTGRGVRSHPQLLRGGRRVGRGRRGERLILRQQPAGGRPEARLRGLRSGRRLSPGSLRAAAPRRSATASSSSVPSSGARVPRPLPASVQHRWGWTVHGRRAHDRAAARVLKRAQAASRAAPALRRAVPMAWWSDRLRPTCSRRSCTQDRSRQVPVSAHSVAAGRGGHPRQQVYASRCARAPAADARRRPSRRRGARPRPRAGRAARSRRRARAPPRRPARPAERARPRTPRPGPLRARARLPRAARSALQLSSGSC